MIRRLVQLVDPVRWWRNRRADKAALAAMTPPQRRVVRAFGIPPRFAHTAVIGTYENAAQERVRWFDYLLSPHLVISRPTHPSENKPPTVARWLCPAPRVRGEAERCLVPLPCETHNVQDHQVGSIIYGNAYLKTEEASR